MSRPSFHKIYMDLALGFSERSTCARLKVGCVITSVDHGYVYAVGYNGNVSGGLNDCDRHGEEAVGNCGCLHAEDNATIKSQVPRDTKKIVYTTHLPCIVCAKRLIQLGGVTKVIYETPYRKTESIDLLQLHGIEVDRYDRGKDALVWVPPMTADTSHVEAWETARRFAIGLP